VLLAGLVASPAMRAVLPMAVLLIVGFALGVDWPGIGGLALAVLLTSCFAAAAASWGITLALRFRTQSAAPLMQAGMFVAVLFTTAYAPQQLLTGWIQDAARINPITRVMDGVRQGFVGDVSWHGTWPALLALAGLLMLLAAFALRGMRRTGR
jgi:ABC-2 type transport system permease protein